jgi:hypothetical protein
MMIDAGFADVRSLSLRKSNDDSFNDRNKNNHDFPCFSAEHNL